MLKHKSLQSFLTTTVVLLGPLYIKFDGFTKKNVSNNRDSRFETFYMIRNHWFFSSPFNLKNIDRFELKWIIPLGNFYKI